MTDIMHVSKAGDSFFSQMGGDEELAVTAFKGFTPYYAQPKHAVLNKGSSALRWAEQLLQGIRDDDPELCNVAVMHAGADLGVKIEKPAEGAPYRFGSAGFFTNDQMNENVTVLTKFIKDRIETSKVFVSNNEWDQIHQYIENAGRYSDATFQKAVKGDSALMIAVRLRSFKAAKYLLHKGVDAAIENSEGETIAGVLKEKQEELMKERNHIRFLRVQAKSLRQMALSHEDQLALLSEPQVYDQLEQNYELCGDISRLMEVRITNCRLLNMKRKLLIVEGKDLSEEELRELSLLDNATESKAIVDLLANEVKDIVMEWEGSKLAKERAITMAKQAEVNKKEEKIKYWRSTLYKSAVKIQAVWRGIRTRYLLELLCLHRACVFVQAKTRGFLCRAQLRRNTLRMLVVMIQSVARGYNGRKKVARKQGRVYPATALVMAVRQKSIKGTGAEQEEPHLPAAEFIRKMFEEADKPKIINTSVKPKGQWAMLKFMGQKKSLAELKEDCVKHRKDGEKIGKLAVLCCEHGTADSSFISPSQRDDFLRWGIMLLEKALGFNSKLDDLVHHFERKRGEAMLEAWRRFDIDADPAYVSAAVEAYGRALKNIECTVVPEVWMGKAIAQEYSGDIGAAIKTVAGMVRKFPNYQKGDEVSMRAAGLYMAKQDYGPACGYVRHANKLGRGSMMLSHMDLILISGRLNELWYEKLVRESEEESDVSEDDSDYSSSDDESDDSEDEREKEKDREKKQKKRQRIAKRTKETAEKKEAYTSAYKVVYRHYVEHRNVFGKRR